MDAAANDEFKLDPDTINNEHLFETGLQLMEENFFHQLLEILQRNDIHNGLDSCELLITSNADAQERSIVTDQDLKENCIVTDQDLKEKCIVTDQDLKEKCIVTDQDLKEKCSDDNVMISSLETEKTVNCNNIEVVTDEERRIRHYSNRQRILLVGEGDFSFASCLATAFGSASNLTATSLDSRDVVIYKYSSGEENLRNLEERGAVVIHEVDVHTMNNHPELNKKLFDRIVFNFPHAGGIVSRSMESSSWYIECHQRVVSGFFEAARCMLSEDGEMHVTHKTAHPFEKWNVVELANNLGLVLKKEVSFYMFDYPGYVNKRAYGSSWDRTFPVGQASTFMFARS